MIKFYFTNNSRKYHGIPKHRKGINKRKPRCKAWEDIGEFIAALNR